MERDFMYKEIGTGTDDFKKIIENDYLLIRQCLLKN